MIYVTERGDAGIHIKEVLEKATWKAPMILITKSPQLILPHISELEKLHPYGNNKAFMVHCTITGYGGTALEPGVPKVSESIKAYHKLVSKIGGQRTVLRIDPIIPTEKGLETAYDVLSKARGRVRISFFDAYPHALKRMTPKMQSKIKSVYNGQFHAPLELRLAAMRTLEGLAPAQTKMIEVCGEPGLPCSGCVSAFDLKAMGCDGDWDRRKGAQRPACACIREKKEMLDHIGQCKHGCLYCYWK
jgi:DNA repair photolyase